MYVATTNRSYKTELDCKANKTLPFCSYIVTIIV